MLNTYLNDNQSMAYPFYGLGSLPFANSVITGMGICIQGTQPAGVEQVYASNVQITEDSVNVAICRQGSTGNLELLGLFYATTDGYYMYLPGYAEWEDDAVYEDLEQVMRYVYHGEDITPDDIPFLPVYKLQTLYSYVEHEISPRLCDTISTGYIQLGSIPPAAVGNYSGTFYLDPSCITYMEDAVYKGYDKYTIGSNEYTTGQRLDLSAAGLLKLSVEGSTVNVGSMYGTNEEELVTIPFATRQQVTSLRGYSVLATDTLAYPVLTMNSNEDKGISITASKGARDTDPVIIEINGTAKFPNCYQEEEE